MTEQSRWKPFAQTKAGRAADGLKLGSESNADRDHSNGLTFILKSALDRGVLWARSQNQSVAFAAAAATTGSTNVRSCLSPAALSYDTQSNRRDLQELPQVSETIVANHLMFVDFESQ